MSRGGAPDDILFDWLVAAAMLFGLGWLLSGCAWLNRPLTEVERAARAFAAGIGCNELQTNCTQMAPNLYRCVYWAAKRDRDGQSYDPFWCRSSESGTVSFGVVAARGEP